MNKLIIEVAQNHDRPEAVTFNKGKENERTVFKQTAYLHTGALYPVRIVNSFDTLPEALEVGYYELLPSSFKAGKYGDIEIDRFNMNFHKLSSNPFKS